MDTYGKRFNAAVAAELRAERGARQLTVDALAEKSGMVKGTLLRYLNARRDIPVPALIEIAAALGVEAGEIMDRAAKRVQAESN